MKQKILDTLERLVLTHPKMPVALHLELALDIKLPFSDKELLYYLEQYEYQQSLDTLSDDGLLNLDLYDDEEAE